MPIANTKAAALLTLLALTLGYHLRTWPLVDLILETLFAVIIYRLTLHPLASYPGPWLAAATDWYNIYYCFTGDRHLDFYRLHEEYGSAVRYGPNRVSFRSATALADIYGSQANTQKSAVYSAFTHFFTVPASLTTIDRKAHAFKRRVTSRALNPRAVQDLEELILQNVRALCTALTIPADPYPLKNNEDPTTEKDPSFSWGRTHDLTTTIKCLLSDIMGDVTFSRHWNMQSSPRNRHILSLMAQGTRGINLAGHMPTLLKLNLDRLCFPTLTRGVQQFFHLSEEQSSWRAAQPPDTLPHRDLFASLLDARDPHSGQGYTPRDLIAEAGFLIIAGTDTTATTITATLFYLLHNQEAYVRAQTEVRAAFEDVENIRIGPALAGCAFLYACVNEALRLNPPVSSVLPRQVLEGGLVVGVMDDNDGGGADRKYFVPEGTDVGVPMYALQRDGRYWVDPHAFRPERWLGVDAEDGGVTAYAPFGAGRTSCVGKYLAYQEMGIILARLLWLFDMRLDSVHREEGDKKKGDATWGRNRRDEFQTRDVFTSSHDGPVVQFRRRI
ncbi:hypothetical protein AtubIFM55763_003598 [Aspergillus tubingensis]|uniref:Similar to benzoate 4-monooxygenase cytochrome P450 n=1 Tax=Aspergillus niger TaxID=5061 RepID=A0A100IJ56_ASPNG|nr:similar to benzoate 4-monooxygenase cytochrome P450 [Aspergillus niger]GLA62285.1 hypothetical protein AtubIFM54640_002831 [Aspergillus tubingensis]GLA72713.1 hypothetical protein AtubIFM55763_003598 [Aspergillus tubingensis]GLB17384.1 hypothetical protein AtubIFM61612_007252 [Aspergillus tubingensis]